eukprot:5698224-Alexandrium_andersonii.AAC.1
MRLCSACAPSPQECRAGGFPEVVTGCLNFKFHGRGQQDTPVGADGGLSALHTTPSEPSDLSD